MLAKLLILLAIPVGLLAQNYDNLSYKQILDSCKGVIVRDSIYSHIIHPSLPPFYFHLLLDEECQCYTLTISASHGSKPIQVLKNHIGPFVPAVDDPDSKEGRVLEFEDYNFDGYMDLKILSDDESPHNSNYDYLFFDSQSFQFVPNDTLAGILRGMIKFDKANKRITSGGVCCFGREYSWGTYTFVNGHYILIERDSQESIPSKNEKELFSIHKLERLINGRMTIVRVDTLR